MSSAVDLPSWIAAMTTAASLLLGSGVGASEGIGITSASGPTGVDSRLDMVAALDAAGPHASLGEEARLFDRFVGGWQTEYETYASDGTVTRGSGEVYFGWIIDGRAMQDIWIGHPKAGSGEERFVGTSLRFYDGTAGLWKVVWVAPTLGNVITLQGAGVGDRIVLEGLGSDGARLRWSFNEIRPDSFVWRGEVSRDGGKTWRLNQEQHMRRRPGGAPTR